MIFINTRQVEEQAASGNGSNAEQQRRRSSVKRKPPNAAWCGCNTPKLGCLISLVYLTISAAACGLHYPLRFESTVLQHSAPDHSDPHPTQPIEQQRASQQMLGAFSMLCMVVPVLEMGAMLTAIKRQAQYDVWSAALLAALGIAIKISAIATLLFVFHAKPMEEHTLNAETALHPHSVVIYVVLMAEVVAMGAALCFKWHLTTFRSESMLTAMVDNKRRESRPSEYLHRGSSSSHPIFDL